MAKHLLSDTKVRNAKAKEKPYRLADGESLYLYVATSGVKSWQFRYRLDGKPQTATLGKYPAKSLISARDAAEKARTDAQDGRHLTVVKRVAKVRKAADAASTFKVVAASWVKREARRQKWTPDYRDEVERSLINHFSALDGLPMVEITAAVCAPVLEAVEDRAPHMLQKVRPRLVAIFDYAAEQGIIVGNPLPRLRRGKKIEHRHFPAVTDLPGVGAILRAARLVDPPPCKGIQRAHVLLAFTALRVSEVIGARWDEMDLEAGTWAVPRERMKRKDADRGPHAVPLPPSLLEQLKEWRKVDGDGSKFVCPAPRDPEKSVTAEGVEKFYSRALDLAGRHSPHSWRSAFSTICREAGKDGDSVEAQLDHVVGNPVASAYDRAKRLDLRRDLMAWYEQTLIAARDGAKVVALKGRRP